MGIILVIVTTPTHGISNAHRRLNNHEDYAEVI